MSDEKNYGEMAGTGKVKAGSAAKMMFEAGMALGKAHKKIAALEARNAEVVAALPKWAEGPGIVGAVLHMAERIAALEAERAEARREGARKALEDAASYWESKDLNISMSQQVTTLDLVSAKLREMAAAIGGEVKGG